MKERKKEKELYVLEFFFFFSFEKGKINRLLVSSGGELWRGGD